MFQTSEDEEDPEMEAASFAELVYPTLITQPAKKQTSWQGIT